MLFFRLCSPYQVERDVRKLESEPRDCRMRLTCSNSLSPASRWGNINLINVYQLESVSTTGGVEEHLVKGLHCDVTTVKGTSRRQYLKLATAWSPWDLKGSLECNEKL